MGCTSSTSARRVFGGLSAASALTDNARLRHKHKRFMTLLSIPDTVDKRVARIEQKNRVGVNKCRAADSGMHDTVAHRDRPLEYAADRTLLPPYGVLLQIAIGVQARHFGAGAGAARGTVVSLAGTKDEVPGVGALGRAADFNMIDAAAVCACNAIAFERLPDFPCVAGERIDIREGNRARLPLREKKPVATPGDVARDQTD